MGEYVQLGDVNTWYEVSGDGDPVVLLHGGLSDGTTWAAQLPGGPAHLVGWSDGGIVALLVSLRRPDLVRRHVLVGTNFHHDGLMDAADLGDDPEAPALGIFKARDDEPIRLEHTLALFDSVPDSQLGMVPGASHMLLLEKPQVCNELMLAFLAETAAPATLFPVRRAEPE
jgi:pimeloyl-ACP methyl ester carboxylesterase